MDSDTPVAEPLFGLKGCNTCGLIFCTRADAEKLERELAASQRLAQVNAETSLFNRNRAEALQRRVEELSAAHAKRLIEIGEMRLRVEEGGT